MERGLRPPPREMDILRRYFDYLEMPEGMWVPFMDAAAISRGELPMDLDNDLMLKVEQVIKLWRIK